MTPAELLEGLAELVKAAETAEAKIKSLESQIEGQRINLDSEMRRADLAERQAKDFKYALDMYAKAWTRELGPYIIGKAHEIDALVGGTRNLRERHESLIAQGQADHRALHDKLGWAHEWHGKSLPPPSRAISAIIEMVDVAQARFSPAAVDILAKELHEFYDEGRYDPEERTPFDVLSESRVALLREAAHEVLEKMRAAITATPRNAQEPRRCTSPCCDFPHGHSGLHGARSQIDGDSR